MSTVALKLFIFISAIISASANGVVLIKPTATVEDQEKTIIDVYKSNTFPTMLSNQGNAEEYLEVAQTFSGGDFLRTAESEYVAHKLSQIGITAKALKIPSTIFDLEIIYLYCTDPEFFKKMNDNAILGFPNYTGIKDYSIVDQYFLQISTQLFDTYASFRSPDDVLLRKNMLINQTLDALPFSKEMLNRNVLFRGNDKGDRNKFLIKKFLSNSEVLTILSNAIGLELDAQHNGNLLFYRATMGIPYQEEAEPKGINITMHPRILERKEQAKEDLEFHFCQFPGLVNRELALPIGSPIESLIENAKKQIHLYPGSIHHKQIAAALAVFEEGGTIIDYPYLGGADILSNGTDVEYKELSFNYSLLGGLFFDGLSANIPSCPICFALTDSETKSNWLYAFSANLKDLISHRDFILPATPLYAAVLDSGEYYHPRLRANYHDSLDFFYSHINVLAVCGSPASDEINVPFLLSLQNSHERLMAKWERRNINEPTTNPSFSHQLASPPMQIDKVAIYDGTKKLHSSLDVPVENDLTLWLRVQDRKEVIEATATFSSGLGTPVRTEKFTNWGRNNWLKLKLGRLAPGTQLRYSLCVHHKSPQGEVIKECFNNGDTQLITIQSNLITAVKIYNGKSVITNNTTSSGNNLVLWLKVANRASIKSARAIIKSSDNQRSEVELERFGKNNWYRATLTEFAPGSRVKYAACVSYDAADGKEIEECKQDKRRYFVDIKTF